MRYCWGFTEDYLNSINPILRPLANYIFKRLKKWDVTTINNVDLYIANSKNVAKRVAQFYNRKAEVVYPPIESTLFKEPLMLSKNKEFYLSFGALTPYKRIDLLVEFFNNNGKKLIIIGNGSEKKKLQKKAKSNIEFKGFLEDDVIKNYIQNSKALVFPGEEDFGMIPLEVMSYGIPVIAFKKGGALETVIENKEDISKSSGLFFEKQDISTLQDVITYFEKIENDFDSIWIRKHAESFVEERFLYSFKQKINNLLLDEMKL